MILSKKTLLLTRVDKILKDLKKIKQPYKLSLLGTVKGIGVNDIDSDHVYLIRRLEYGDIVILERFIRSKDKELDDFIISKTFSKDSVPKTWKFKIKK